MLCVRCCGRWCLLRRPPVAGDGQYLAVSFLNSVFRLSREETENFVSENVESQERAHQGALRIPSSYKASEP